jgi:NADH-quinone oxidoreductase subunit M
MLMVGHGLSAALLFLLCTAVQHRTRSYYLDEMGGLGKDAPVLVGFLMAAMMASIGLPGFANFWGELSIFVSLWSWNPLFMVLALLGIVISAVYGLRAVASIAFGPQTEAYLAIRKEYPVSDLRMSERVPASLLLLALVLFGLFPSWISRPVDHTLSASIRERETLKPDTFQVLPAGSILELQASPKDVSSETSH